MGNIPNNLRSLQHSSLKHRCHWYPVHSYLCPWDKIPKRTTFKRGGICLGPSPRESMEDYLTSWKLRKGDTSRPVPSSSSPCVHPVPVGSQVAPITLRGRLPPLSSFKHPAISRDKSHHHPGGSKSSSKSKTRQIGHQMPL